MPVECVVETVMVLRDTNEIGVSQPRMPKRYDAQLIITGQEVWSTCHRDPFVRSRVESGRTFSWGVKATKVRSTASPTAPVVPCTTIPVRGAVGMRVQESASERPMRIKMGCTASRDRWPFSELHADPVTMDPSVFLCSSPVYTGFPSMSYVMSCSEYKSRVASTKSRVCGATR
jgi:hypothetical protein